MNITPPPRGFVPLVAPAYAIQAFAAVAEPARGYLFLAHARAAVQGDLNDALQDLTRAMAAAPRFPLIYRDIGCVRAGMNSYADAVSDFGECLSLCPEDAAAYRLRACAHVALGHFHLALPDFDEAVGRNPKDWLALHYLANALRFMGQPFEARKVDVRIEEINPSRGPIPQTPWEFSTLYLLSVK